MVGRPQWAASWGLLFALGVGAGGCSCSPFIARVKQFIAAEPVAGATEVLHAEVASDNGDGLREGDVVAGDELDLNDPPVVTAKKSSALALLDECTHRGAAHRTLDITNVHVQGTITGHTSGSVAMLNDGKHENQVLRVGEYFGSHCWRVSEIGQEHVVLEEPYVDLDGTEHLHAVRVGIGEAARHDAMSTQ